MKNFTFIAVLALIAGLMGNSALGVEYGTDFLEPGNPGGWSAGFKTFDTVNPATVSPGETFAIDIWAADIPETIISGGFEMFYNPAQVSLVSVAAYDGEDIAGPWDSETTTKIPDAHGPGSYAIALAQLGCVPPDSANDVILARVTFQCLAAGSSEISIQGIEDFDTTVGCTSAVVYDSQMGTHTMVISQEGQGTSTTTSPSSTTSSGITSSTTSSATPATTTIRRCLSESLYGGNAEETKLLRYFRDNVLSRTAEGRELIFQYYLWSPAIVSAMEGNQEFQAWVKEMIDEVLPMIEEAVVATID